ncbi:thioredoxin family protein [Oceanimonas baumannii]|uniref:Thioredoxin n=1 Tax=Oceanimonas baumannii TaxID=129578 RepID=A0A235CNN6_9GAMM|nr:thioredoxin family protein [Oceanimonas baumannii]OYD26046.1 thiol reductase thioredoxin [Oceanimonas baumannii]TDW62312.1 thioredoxin [Oceanimonas baumannii]
MLSVTGQSQLDILLAGHPAVLVLYGGRHCGVCQAFKPRLQQLLAGQFPQVLACYADCQADSASLCAQQGVMALPVVQLWFEGKRFAEFFRVFSLSDIQQALERPYAFLFNKQ